MAYDRYDRDQHGWRDNDRSSGRGDERGRGYAQRGQQDRWGGGQDYDRHERDQGGSGQRGFFERASEEIRGWFGGDEHDRRERDSYDDGRGRGRGYERNYGREQERGSNDRDDRGRAQPTRWSTSQEDYTPSHRREPWGGGDREQRDFTRDRHQGPDRGGYRPMTGDYGRSHRGSDFAQNRGAWDYEPRGGGMDRGGRDRPEPDSKWDRDEYRRTSYAGSGERHHRDEPFYEGRREQRMHRDDDHRERGAMFGRERDDRQRPRRFEDERHERDDGPHILDRSFPGTYR